MDINLESQIKLFNDLASFPITGTDKTIYIDKSNGNQYYWSGTAYVQLKDSTKFPQPTGTSSQYIRGDGSLETFPNIPDVSGKQDVPIVVNANITAVNDGNYTVVANATFTDPTPAAGKGFRVFVRNGTAVVGGISYAVAGTEIIRLFHSGSWANYTNITDLSGYVPTSRTINGLDLSANRTLTTSDINDSTDKRYVTDAQLTVIGNTSGTNTGDQDLSGLFVICGNSNVTTPSGLTRYISPNQSSPLATEIARCIVIPRTVTLGKFYIQTTNTQPASGSAIINVRKNAVNTGISITIPAGSAAGVFSDLTNSETFSAGDLISFEHINNATANSAIIGSISIINI